MPALSPLQQPLFRTIWVGYVVTQAGFWISNVSLQLLVVNLTHANALAQGALAFFNYIPMLIFSPLAGVLADRYERKLVAAGAQLVVAVAAAVLTALTLIGVGNLWLLYAMAFALGLGMALGQPVAQAIVVNAVPAADLSSAIALQLATINLARIAGPALSVLVIVAWGPAAAFALYAGCSLLTAIIFVRLRLAQPERVRLPGNWIRQAREGVVHAASRPPAMKVLSMVFVVGFFISTYNTLAPVVTVRLLHQPARQFFGLIVAIGIGALVGGISAGRDQRSTLPRMGLRLAAIGAVLAGIGLSSDYRITVAFSAVFGALQFGLMSKLATMLHNLVEDAARGRVMGLWMIGWGGMAPFGGLALGALASAFGPAVALWLFGGVVAAYGVFMAATSMRTPIVAAAEAIP